MKYQVIQQISKDRRDYGPGETIELSEDEAAVYNGCLISIAEIRETVSRAAKSSRKAVKRGPNVDTDRGARD